MTLGHISALFIITVTSFAAADVPLYVPADLSCSELWGIHNRLSADGIGDGGIWVEAGAMCNITYSGAAISTPEGRVTVSYDTSYQVHKELLSQILNTVLRVRERDSRQVGDPFIAPYLAGVYQRLGLEYSGLLCFPRITLLWRRLAAAQHHQATATAAAAAAAAATTVTWAQHTAASGAAAAAAGAPARGQGAGADTAADEPAPANAGEGGTPQSSRPSSRYRSAARVVPLEWHVQQLHRDLVLEPWKPVDLRLMLSRAAAYTEALGASTATHTVSGGPCAASTSASPGTAASSFPDPSYTSSTARAGPSGSSFSTPTTRHAYAHSEHQYHGYYQHRHHHHTQPSWLPRHVTLLLRNIAGGDRATTAAAAAAAAAVAAGGGGGGGFGMGLGFGASGYGYGSFAGAARGGVGGAGSGFGVGDATSGDAAGEGCDGAQAGGRSSGGTGSGGGGEVFGVALFWAMWLACPTVLVALEAMQTAADNPWLAVYICVIATCLTIAEWRTTTSLALAPGLTPLRRLYGIGAAHTASAASAALVTGLLNTWLPLLGQGAAVAVVWLHILVLPAAMVAVMSVAGMPLLKALQLAASDRQGNRTSSSGDDDEADAWRRRRRGDVSNAGRGRRRHGVDSFDVAGLRPRRTARDAEGSRTDAGYGTGGGGSRGSRTDSVAAAVAAAQQVHWPPALEVPAWLDDWPNAPEAFRCPITQSLMREPAQASSGVTYERPAIMQWLARRRVDPVTHVPLKRHRLAPNLNLRHMIEVWVQDRVDARKRLAQRLRDEIITSSEAVAATLAAVTAAAAAPSSVAGPPPTPPQPLPPPAMTMTTAAARCDSGDTASTLGPCSLGAVMVEARAQRERRGMQVATAGGRGGGVGAGGAAGGASGAAAAVSGCGRAAGIVGMVLAEGAEAGGDERQTSEEVEALASATARTRVGGCRHSRPHHLAQSQAALAQAASALSSLWGAHPDLPARSPCRRPSCCEGGAGAGAAGAGAGAAGDGGGAAGSVVGPPHIRHDALDAAPDIGVGIEEDDEDGAVEEEGAEPESGDQRASVGTGGGCGHDDGAAVRAGLCSVSAVATDGQQDQAAGGQPGRVSRTAAAMATSVAGSCSSTATASPYGWEQWSRAEGAGRGHECAGAAAAAGMAGLTRGCGVAACGISTAPGSSTILGGGTTLLWGAPQRPSPADVERASQEPYPKGSRAGASDAGAVDGDREDTGLVPVMPHADPRWEGEGWSSDAGATDGDSVRSRQLRAAGRGLHAARGHH